MRCAHGLCREPPTSATHTIQRGGRKISRGTQSERGNRWIERVCSVRESCRLQRRPVIGYLIDVATASQQRGPIPTLVPT